MLFFRKRTIFHMERNSPDPEDIKFRFRRRIFFFSLIGAICLLGVPVFRDLLNVLIARDDARKFVQLVLEAREKATHNRATVSLHFQENNNQWVLQEHLGTSTCESATTSETALPFRPTSQWQFSAITDKDLCFSPRIGLLQDHVARTSTLLLKVTANTKSEHPEGIEIQMDPQLFQIETQNL